MKRSRFFPLFGALKDFWVYFDPTNWREMIPNFSVKLAEELTSGWATG